MWTFHRGNEAARAFVARYSTPRALRAALWSGLTMPPEFDALDLGGVTTGEAEVVLARIAAYGEHYKLWHAPDGTVLKHHMQAGEERDLPPA